MMSIPISFLPIFVVMILALGEAAISQENWAIQYIERYKIRPEQVNQLGAIEKQYSDQTAQFRQELNQAESELTELMTGTASATQLREKARQLEALKIKGTQLYFEEFIKIREELTQEQRHQFDPFKTVEKG